MVRIPRIYNLTSASTRVSVTLGSLSTAPRTVPPSPGRLRVDTLSHPLLCPSPTPPAAASINFNSENSSLKVSINIKVY